MIGIYVAWGERKNSPGWIIDGTGCHIWMGSRREGGYGWVWWNGHATPAHRARYEREIGPVPDGMMMDHFQCNNKACCNPRHVRPVTPRENTLRGDSIGALNAAKTHCKHGHLLEGRNLLVDGVRRGWRLCRACHYARVRRRRGAV